MQRGTESFPGLMTTEKDKNLTVIWCIHVFWKHYINPSESTIDKLKITNMNANYMKK